jgi:hypothetical protein
MPRVNKSDSPKTLLRRAGYPATVLRVSGMASAMIGAPLSLTLIVVILIVNDHHPVTTTPFIVTVLIYLLVAVPFSILQFRRRFQSDREDRAFRAAASAEPGE